MLDAKAVRLGLVTAALSVVGGLLLPWAFLGVLWTLSKLVPPGQHGSIELVDTHWQFELTGGGVAELLVLALVGFLLGVIVARRQARTRQ